MKKSPEQYTQNQKIERVQCKEVEKLPPVFFIYRDNDLFQEQIPQMVEVLKSLGREVEIQTFPKGTKEEEITKWTQENIKQLKGKEILSDYTFQYHGAYEGLSEKARSELNFKNKGEYLDKTLNKAVEDILKIDYESVRKEENIDKVGEYFSIIVKKVLEDKENIPEKIFIVSSNLLDHYPFSADADYKLKVEEFRNTEVIRQKQLKAAEKIKEWFTKAGMPEKSLEIKESLKNLLKDFDQKTWIIVDRHATAISKEIAEKFKKDYTNNIKLGLPLEEFYSDVTKYGLIKAQKIEEAVKKILEKDFGKEKEGIGD